MLIKGEHKKLPLYQIYFSRISFYSLRLAKSDVFTPRDGLQVSLKTCDWSKVTNYELSLDKTDSIPFFSKDFGSISGLWTSLFSLKINR